MSYELGSRPPHRAGEAATTPQGDRAGEGAPILGATGLPLRATSELS